MALLDDPTCPSGDGTSGFASKAYRQLDSLPTWYAVSMHLGRAGDNETAFVCLQTFGSDTC